MFVPNLRTNASGTTWSGGRWQMKQSDYGWVKLAGGVFLSLVDSQTGNLKLGGIPIPS